MDKEYTLRLREIRRAKHLTQGDLASMLGVTERIVGCWERGDTALSLKDAADCAKALGCTLNDLCGWDEPSTKPEPAHAPDPLAQELVERYGELSADGRVNLLGVARGLSSLPEYRAPDVARPPQG